MIMVNIYFYHFDLIIVNIKSAYYCIISYKENIYNIKMCGIVGVITKNDDLFMLLMHGLKQLQNRGYDSAGISTIFENNFQFIHDEYIHVHDEQNSALAILFMKNRIRKYRLLPPLLSPPSPAPP